jgi:hypothetical protein
MLEASNEEIFLHLRGRHCAYGRYRCGLTKYCVGGAVRQK